MANADWYQKREGQAEHLVYLDNEGKELEKLINGEKSMIIRGAAGKKSPLGGRAKENDILYFVEKGGNMEITHRGVLTKVIEKYKMTPEESTEFIKGFGQELNLSEKQKTRWYGKKCIGLYEVSHLEKIEPFYYNREKNMDDWIITDNIEDIKLSQYDFSKEHPMTNWPGHWVFDFAKEQHSMFKKALYLLKQILQKALILTINF